MGIYYDKTKIFAQKYVAPSSVETDKLTSFATEAFKYLGDEHYLELLIPEELGGQGGGLLEHAEVCMALAEENPSAALCYMMHNVALKCVLTHGNSEMKERIAREVIEKKHILALAYSEFGTGVHFYNPEIKVAIKDGKTILNGKKSMVTSATFASYYLVVAPSQVKEEATNNWLIPRDKTGISFEMGKWHALGMKGNVSCPMILKDVTLDEADRIGGEGEGSEQIFTTIAAFFLTGLAAINSAIALKQSRLANDHAVKRSYPHDFHLSEIETIQIHLGKIYMLAESSKALTLEAARAGAAGAADAVAKIFAARIQASEAAIEASRLAMRVGGGRAYNQGSEIERYLRDAYAGQIMAPSVDVLNVWLGKVITDQPIP